MEFAQIESEKLSFKSASSLNFKTRIISGSQKYLRTHSIGMYQMIASAYKKDTSKKNSISAVSQRNFEKSPNGKNIEKLWDSKQNFFNDTVEDCSIALQNLSDRFH
ncbi:hypothetical protein RF11_04062 [Thelohanellus kitauei]|uniref:Uncharacterized protein n=1 Tax=Thelohanellus kitauei TaxID=669202 RepID=A0A0C2IV78_THEKT|nr:hypothetical protein RF11_04062 [Thelohanellus kitauei]